ncbi:hypothetical protein MXAN_2487 [Myxococcus xanthus DK 1622]|uniref:Uncharacterized protein n=1 Tax=Myxococcus xanthus (strain DK1622) TaxID=246197 RepID=Q1D9G7_MYXXD|nr:hypothetical protein MXAN_2487 [Myxococcus xanthus DK 1622]
MGASRGDLPRGKKGLFKREGAHRIKSRVFE